MFSASKSFFSKGKGRIDKGITNGVLSAFIFLTLLASRRWLQLISPQVWDEDGTRIIYEYAMHGWRAILDPVNGYLVTLPRLISALSVEISFLHYPIVSTLICWAFIVSVGLAITLAPTNLRGRFACALAIFVIPSDPEVFGLPLYSFWWSSLLLFLVALWDEKNKSIGFRILFLLVGGLSSPVILLLCPILILRAYYFKAFPSERIVAAVACCVAAVQLPFIVRSGASHIPPIDSILSNVIPTFFGTFLIGNWSGSRFWMWHIGVCVLGLIATWAFQNRKNITAMTLVYLLFGSIALAIARNDPAILHPRFAGPRYFFFPFVLILWILIQQFYVTESRKMLVALSVVAALSLVNDIPAWSRRHDDLSWADHIRSCRHFPEYAIPVQFDGNQFSAWHFQLPGKTCVALMAGGLFSADTHTPSPTFSYTVRQATTGDHERENVVLIGATMKGTDYQQTKLDGFRVIGSYGTSDSDVGDVVIKAKRGDRLLYRSGPGAMHGQTMTIVGYEQKFISKLPSAVEWSVLEFSNVQLPEEFVVRIRDSGTGFGEWSAVAVRADQ